MFFRIKRNNNIKVKFLALVSLLVIGIYLNVRIHGTTLERSVYSEAFGEIRVKEIEISPFSFKGLLGAGEKVYRCEFRNSPGGVLISAIALQEDSYRVQQIEITWHSARRATVSFDHAIFYEIEDGHWRKVSNPHIENESL
jgi:hypothetical protein